MCPNFKSKVDLPKKFYSKKVLFTIQFKVWFDAEVAETFLANT